MSTIKIQKNEEGFTIYEEISEITEEQYKLLEKLVEKHKAKEQEKKGLWRPERGEEYYTICDESPSINLKTNAFQDQTDLDFSLGNCFKSFKEAQAELGRRKALTRIKDYIAREGIERKKDWFDGDTFYSLIRSWGFSVEDTEKIIQACESDLKILFGIN